jgi:tRNA wybutosine-synthesizing protein 2
MKTPYDRIKELACGITEKPPEHWEKIGDIVVLRMDKSQHEQELGAIYAEVLGARSVVVEESIDGIERKPSIRLIYGQSTETTVRENGLLYRMDVSKVMFSSGNKKERARMAHVARPEENVLDMFAGIGYFSIPLGKNASVYSCEINEDAFHYLCENMRLNRAMVRPFLGDNREIVPSLNMKFDRIVMGYLKDTYEFLPLALEALKDRGTIHYHEAFRDKAKTIERVEEICSSCGREIKGIKENRIKSIAPHIEHYVFDLSF